MRQPETPKSAKSAVEPASDAFSVDSTENAHMEPAAHEHIPVATGYAPGTGSRLRIFAGAFALILVVTFLVIQHIKGRDEAMLGAATASIAELAPQVDVVKVALAPPAEVLTLPGETRGWFSSTIYARVSGYVAKWIVDIGDRVTKDQVLAIIDTPELDAQLEAAQAQFAASEAEVKVREADAEFAKTTFERWQGSPKGVANPEPGARGQEGRVMQSASPN